VTGGAGFIGRYVVERLVERGDAVRSIVRRPSPELERMGVETIHADIADASAMARACEGVQEVHHVAACVELWHDPDELRRTNVEGTRSVIDACLNAGVGRLIFTSSASVVFGGDDQEGVDESAPYPRRYVSRYAETKARAEQLVVDAHGRGALRTLALRPHLVWGPRDTHFIPGLVARARGGGLVQVGDGRNRVDVTFVENLAGAHVLAADRLRERPDVGGRPYFISQGEPVEAWSFIGLLLERMGLARPARAISFRRAYALGAACEAAWALLRRRGAPPMTRFLASQMAKSHYFDISAARRHLGYEPRVSTLEGIDRLIAAMPAVAR
jgi:2-alkyl-3-oxoalkanoate reductase